MSEHIKAGLQLSVENSSLHRMRAKAEAVLLAHQATGDSDMFKVGIMVSGWSEGWTCGVVGSSKGLVGY